MSRLWKQQKTLVARLCFSLHKLGLLCAHGSSSTCSSEGLSQAACCMSCGQLWLQAEAGHLLPMRLVWQHIPCTHAPTHARTHV